MTHVYSLAPRFIGLLLSWSLVLAFAGADEPATSPETTTDPPRLVIRGMGLIDNRKLRRMIQNTYPEEVRGNPYNANFVEDAFAILRNQLHAEGFQEAYIRAKLTLVDESIVELAWDGKSEIDVPRPIEVMEARFQVDQGPLFHYHTFEIEGLTALSEARAKGFFFKTDMLLRLDRNRRFSRLQLGTSVSNLRRELVNLGYREAQIEIIKTEQDKETGRVDVRLRVDEGKKHVVNEVVVKSPDGEEILQVGEPWSPHWEQDFTTSLRNNQYLLGRPDARAQIVEITTTERDDLVDVRLTARVDPGEPVLLGDVRFEGYERTSESWLKRKASVEGPLVDRLEIDNVRNRLARQGVFDFVGVRLDPDTGPERDVVFDVTEGKRVDFSLLAGYGSFDQFFGGAELDNFNLWGIGHSSRLRGMLSRRTANILYTYTIPELFLRDLSWFWNVDALLREELTFERQEIITALGFRKSFPLAQLQLGARYSYQFLKTEDSPDPVTNNDFTRVSAVIFDGQLERRDNPLAPREGYRVFSTLEVANPAIGAQANYQLLQLGVSGHAPIKRGLIAHASLQHRVAFSPDSLVDLPFNKRFFDGGDNSVRGFQRGGASPYNAQGQQIGAEVSLQWNLELEQYLTERWAVVAFVDGVGNSPDLADYPFRDVLWSVGGGIRWNTIIGPVRAEYGYNLNPRTFDPVGTLQVAIGFPF